MLTYVFNDESCDASQEAKGRAISHVTVDGVDNGVSGKTLLQPRCIMWSRCHVAVVGHHNHDGGSPQPRWHFSFNRSPGAKAEGDVKDTGRGHQSLIKDRSGVSWAKVTL
jgi:hypothetical protein